MDRLNKIERLKDLLFSTDYKAVKNAELEAIGESPEYNPQELHAERQAVRDEINSIESMTDEEYYEAYPEEVEIVEVVIPEEEEVEEPDAPDAIGDDDIEENEA